MNTSKIAIIANQVFGKVLSIIGYTGGVFFLLGLIGFIIYGADEGDSTIVSIVVVAFFLAICVLMIWRAIAIKQRIRRFKQYIALISKQQMTSLENIAASTNRTVEFVIADMNRMVKKRFFANATIDTTTNEIIIGGRKQEATVAPQSAQVEQVSYICAGCDAQGYKPKGVNISCEYCGNTL
jgi:uncharacterized protein YaaW (UPF0174 family)